MYRFLALAFIALSACVATTEDPSPQPAPQTKPQQTQRESVAVPQGAARQFVRVIETMEPVAERECRARTRGINCDFLIVVDDRPGQPPNALQTKDRSGRPILAFTASLLNEVRNADELAFVVGHEAAHHILHHLDETQRNAQRAAVIFSGVAAILGGTPEEVKEAERAGAAAGVLAYSKDHELEADQLGTIITHNAGYNPLRGAQFFNRLPDPKNRFLSTHPGNQQRIQVVRQTAAQLGVNG
jgi:Zn-dependent protease with chaperone function